MLFGEHLYDPGFVSRRGVPFHLMQPFGGARHALVLHHREELCQSERVGRQQLDQIVQTLRVRRPGVSEAVRKEPRIALVERPELHRVALPAPCSSVSRRDNRMPDLRWKVLSDQFEVKGVVEDVEASRFSELLVNAADEHRDLVVCRDLQVVCHVQEGGGKVLLRVRRDPEGVVVAALHLEPLEHLYCELRLSYAGGACDCLGDDRLAARRECLEELAEFFLPPGIVAKDVGRDQSVLLLWPGAGGSLASERAAAGRGLSVPASENSEIPHVDERPHAFLSVGKDVNATADGTRRQASQSPCRFFWIGETLGEERNGNPPRERSRSLGNPPYEPPSDLKDLHETVSL